MSTQVQVWLCEVVDLEPLLPEPNGWRRIEFDHQGVRHTCWEFVGEEWLVDACSPEPIDRSDSEIDVPQQVRQLLPCVRYLVGVSVEPSNPPDAGWIFLNHVVTSLASQSGGLAFDVFTGEPIRSPTG
jgi:hypothetical protein